MKTLLTLFCVLLISSTALATEVEIRPLRVSNQAPLVRLCGLPALERARLLPAGTYELGFSWDLANSYTLGGNASEQLVFDGESQRLALRLERGFARGWELGVEVPLIAHRQGVFDDFIENWHDIFGLPQGGRDLAPADQLEYSYRKDAGTLFSLQNEETGLGDIRLFLGRQLRSSEDSALALHSSLEIPSGDDAELLGSGSVDAALWVSGEELWHPAGQRLGLHWGVGLLATLAEELLSVPRQPLVGTGSLGLAWSAWPRLVLQLQVDAHTSVFDDSGLRQIDDASAQLAMGGALSLTPQTRLELALVEDVTVDTAPDVNFHLLLSQRF